MFKIKLIVIGKIKEKYFEEAENEFLKRLGPYVKLEIIELKEIGFGKNVDVEKIKLQEGVKIIEVLEKTDSHVVGLDRSGEQYNSEDFARYLENWCSGGGEIVFVIGGALGLSKDVLKRVESKISLSKMTFTHTMARVFLLEQIYRAATILNNKKYHY